MRRPVVGIIGGSGLYSMDGIEELHEERVETPFGSPSDAYVCGSLEGADVVFLARHGRGHRFSPSEVPYRANLFGMKLLGVEWIVSVSAVGSLREDIAPGHMVMVDQFIDRTVRRPSTFFSDGIVAHAGFGDPVCGTLRSMLLEAARAAGAVAHDGGTYVCMEGPAFSTRAESNLYRSWGASVVGMTNIPEAKLAREAGISYATLAMSTDYDCWHVAHEAVTVEQVVRIMAANSALARRIIRETIPRVVEYGAPPPMADAMANSILTAPDAIPEERRRALAPLIGRFLS
jgi:5'-methylthioadenosine phosphorylase